jgi:DNA anti-recombination protein RmuC
MTMKNKIESIEHNEITIDELAGMTARGFAAVDEKFSRIDERFDRLEQKIDDLSTNLGNLATSMQNGFNTVNGRIDGIYLNYVTIREHKVLADRVKRLER